MLLCFLTFVLLLSFLSLEAHNVSGHDVRTFLDIRNGAAEISDTCGVDCQGNNIRATSPFHLELEVGNCERKGVTKEGLIF